MWQKEKGILLGAVRHNDKTSVIRIFTESAGTVPYIFHMAQSTRSSARNALLQPLTQIEFESRIVQSDQLQHLKDPRNLHPYQDIPCNPAKGCMVLFLSELLTYALRNEDCNPELFRFLCNAMDRLDQSKCFSNFHLKFILDLCCYLGISPNEDDAQPGSWLDLRDGTFIPTPPAHHDYMDQKLSCKTAMLMSCGEADAEDVPMTGKSRSELLTALNLYLRLHIPEFPVLKSLEVLQSIYS